MEWHYKIIELTDKLNEKYYALVEFYPNLRAQLAEDPDVREVYDADGSPDAWSEPIIIGDSKADIHRQLLQMLKDTL